MYVCIDYMLKRKSRADLRGRVSQVLSWWVGDNSMVTYDLAEEANLKKMRAA